MFKDANAARFAIDKQGRIHLSGILNYEAMYRDNGLWAYSYPYYRLQAIATNAKGETQPMDFPNKWDGLGYGNNMVFPHSVEVGQE